MKEESFNHIFKYLIVRHQRYCWITPNQFDLLLIFRVTGSPPESSVLYF